MFRSGKHEHYFPAITIPS
jgi:sodium/potassium-transporting ATPase subunit alpha